jgi:hypothetical protein
MKEQETSAENQERIRRELESRASSMKIFSSGKRRPSKRTPPRIGKIGGNGGKDTGRCSGGTNDVSKKKWKKRYGFCENPWNPR